ncbi:hypothetical protein LX32DRAFT_364953 [Colletotrichum zoysiae]|uniref:Uncharacterized protein n=1 Tax=Colletotrichum zoysiae TaxID=1216348 RepID=A0AAD9HJL0_9PEZI|nr:hypothetical protein LX32DRAFT_364953 [Colletotrichum zoysiae]
MQKKHLLSKTYEKISAPDNLIWDGRIINSTYYPSIGRDRQGTNTYLPVVMHCHRYATASALTCRTGSFPKRMDPHPQSPIDASNSTGLAWPEQTGAYLLPFGLITTAKAFIEGARTTDRSRLDPSIQPSSPTTSHPPATTHHSLHVASRNSPSSHKPLTQPFPSLKPISPTEKEKKTDPPSVTSRTTDTQSSDLES